MSKFNGLTFWFSDKPLLENVPAKEFKRFVLGLMEFAENGKRPERLSSATANNIQETFLLRIGRSRVNSANGAMGAEVTNNLYETRKTKRNADGETGESADGPKKEERINRENNIVITKESVTERPPPQEHRHGCGIHQNVMLTDEEKTSLESVYGIPPAYIDHFSNALKTKGYRYESHSDAIREWWEKDKTTPRWQSEKQQQHGSFDTNDFLNAAVTRSLGEEYAPSQYRKKEGKT